MFARLSTFIAPPVFADEDQTRNARLTYILLLAVLFLACTSIALNYLFTPQPYAIALNVISIPVLIGLLVLVRRGYVAQVGIAFAMLMWLVITTTAFLYDGFANPVISLYTLPILIAGLLMSFQAGLGIAGLSILTSIGFALTAQPEASPLTGSSPVGTRLGYYIALFTFAAVAIHLSVGAIRQALLRARHTEQHLRESHQRLQAASETREAMQRALEANEQRWRVALDSSDMGVWDMNLETGAVYRSPRYLELLHYTADEMAAMPDSTQLFHPDDRQRVLTKREAYVNGEADAYEEEARILCGDGVYRWFLYRGKISDHDPEQFPRRFTGTLTDMTRRKAMEAALEESELRWRFALEGRSAGVWDAKLEEGTVFRSPRYLALVGYTAETMPPLSAILHPDEAAAEARFAAFLISHHALYEDEYRLRRGDGQYRWFSAQGKIIERKTDGTAKRVVGTLTDITERKAMEAAIRDSEQAYRSLYENNPNPMWVYDSQTHDILAVNDAALHLYGYTRDEFLRLTLWDLVQPAEATRLKAYLAGGMQSFSAPDIWTHQHKDGAGIPVEVSAHETVFQERAARLVMVRDMTIQKETEELLRTSQELFAHIFENVPVGVTLSRLRDGQFITVNPYFADMVEYTPANLVGHTSTELNLIENGIRHKHTTAIQGQFPRSYKTELKLKTRSGRTIDTVISTQVITLEGEMVLLTILLDVTTIKRAERERMQIEMLQNELDQQREVVELKERFISGVSHEFRSPLAIMLSGTGILRLHDDKFSAAQRIERLEKIETQIQYLNELLDRVLTLSKGRAGKLPFRPQALGIVEFCRDLLEDCRLSDHNQHQFIFEASGNFENAHMDAKLIQHILTNLVSNAVKYSPANTAVHLRLRRDDSAVVIQVVDNGIGIPEDEQQHIFEPFFRSKNAEKFKGTGLGLSITKESIEAHHGSIEWESQPGQGTVFTVRLPGGFDSGDGISV